MSEINTNFNNQIDFQTENERSQSFLHEKSEFDSILTTRSPKLDEIYVNRSTDKSNKINDKLSKNSSYDANNISYNTRDNIFNGYMNTFSKNINCNSYQKGNRFNNISISNNNSNKLSQNNSDNNKISSFNDSNNYDNNINKKKYKDVNNISNNSKKRSVRKTLSEEEILLKNEQRRYKELIRKHKISCFFSKKLQCLYTFKIVFILDDSGSMNKTLDDSPLNKGYTKATRWDELQEFARISIEIANLFNTNGCDMYFLNRPMAKGVRVPDEIAPYFVNKPSGFTPITKIFTKVLKSNPVTVLGDRKLLIVIVTDGEPTDNEGLL